MKNQAFINWNNGPNGPFHTSKHPLKMKGDSVFCKVFDYWYKIQVNLEGSFFIRKDGKKHSTVLIS